MLAKIVKYNLVFNLLCNILFCVFSLLVFRFNFIALVFCYIASEVIFWLANKKIEQAVARQNLDNEDLAGAVGEENEAYFSELIDQMKEEREKLEEERKKKEEEEAKAQAELKNRQNRYYSNAEDLIASFLDFYENEVSEETKRNLPCVNQVQNDFLQLKESIQERPQNSSTIGSRMFTYTEEFRNLISSYQKLSGKKRQEYKEKYEVMGHEYHKYLNDRIKEIMTESDSDINVSLKTLTQSLMEDNHS